jgi:CheY-like chemotaxis protein
MMKNSEKSIFLADDDGDDCLLFEDALREINRRTQLTTASDGVQLMDILMKRGSALPDIIFLDLNMPCKNGFECLQEIKGSPALRFIPVIIFSTSAQPDTIDKVYAQGANYYICKPGTFLLLKKAIEYVLSINWQEDSIQPPREKFVIQP